MVSMGSVMTMLKLTPLDLMKMLKWPLTKDVERPWSNYHDYSSHEEGGGGRGAVCLTL